MRAALPAVADTPAEGASGYAAKAASGSAWTTLQTVTNKFVTVFATLLLAHFLTPAEIGLGNLAVSIAVFAFVLAPVVMGDVLIAEKSRLDTVGGTASRVAWIAGIAQCLALTALAVPIERLSGKPGLAFLVVVAAMRPIANATLMLPDVRLRLDLAYRTIAMVDGAVILGATVLGVVMAALGAGPVSVTLPPILTLAVRGMVYRGIVRHRLPHGYDRSLALPLLGRFAVASTGQYFNNLRAVLEVLVLGLFATETEIGYFGLAYTLAIQANSVIAGQLGAVLQPIFGHIGDDPKRQIAGFVRATRLLSTISVPLSLLQAALALPLFGLFFAEGWAPAAPILAALSVGQAFVFVSAPAIALLKAQGRFRTYVAWQACQLVVSTGIFLLAVGGDGTWALEASNALGLEISVDSARAFAIAVVSTLAWAVFCPVAYWLGGRPASLPMRTVIGVFLEPWLTSVPIVAGVSLAWIGLRGIIPPPWADAVALFAIGPVAGVLAIGACVVTRSSVRRDFLALVERFCARRSPRP
jgi:PST family polysaccharide transporter